MRAIFGWIAVLVAQQGAPSRDLAVDEAFLELMSKVPLSSIGRGQDLACTIRVPQGAKADERRASVAAQLLALARGHASLMSCVVAGAPLAITASERAEEHALAPKGDSTTAQTVSEGDAEERRQAAISAGAEWMLDIAILDAPLRISASLHLVDEGLWSATVPRDAALAEVAIPEETFDRPPIEKGPLRFASTPQTVASVDDRILSITQCSTADRRLHVLTEKALVAFPIMAGRLGLPERAPLSEHAPARIPSRDPIGRLTCDERGTLYVGTSSFETGFAGPKQTPGIPVGLRSDGQMRFVRADGGRNVLARKLDRSSGESEVLPLSFFELLLEPALPEGMRILGVTTDLQLVALSESLDRVTPIDQSGPSFGVDTTGKSARLVLTSTRTGPVDELRLRAVDPLSPQISDRIEIPGRIVAVFAGGSVVYVGRIHRGRHEIVMVRTSEEGSARLIRVDVILGLASLLLAGAAEAADRPRYGDTAQLAIFGQVLKLDPHAPSSAVEALIFRHAFEPLYRIGPGGIENGLARAAPEIRGAQVVVAIDGGRTLHDGRTLTPSLIVRTWQAAVEKGRVPVPLLLVRGTHERATGNTTATLGIAADDRAGTITFELIAPYAEFARLLALDDSGLIFERSGGAKACTSGDPTCTNSNLGDWVGTGPFFMERPTGELFALAPHLQHPAGRPYLDRLEIRVLQSRVSATAALRKNDPMLITGVPDLRSLKHHAQVQGTDAANALDVISLVLGDGNPALTAVHARRAIDIGLDRATLARRFLGDQARPISTLFGENSKPAIEARSTDERPAALRATLLIADGDREARRLSERIQLDLLQLGITLTIDRTTSNDMRARRRNRNFEMMIDNVWPRVGADAPAVDRFHALLAIAAERSAAGKIPPTLLRAFCTATDAERSRILIEVEETLRYGAGILPIAVRSMPWAISTTLQEAVSEKGRIDLANAHVVRGVKP